MKNTYFKVLIRVEIFIFLNENAGNILKRIFGTWNKMKNNIYFYSGPSYLNSLV